MFTSSQLGFVNDGSFRPQLFTHTFVYRSRHRSSVERTVCKKWGAKTKYRKVTSSNMSRFEAHAGFFRLLMKGIFDP